MRKSKNNMSEVRRILLITLKQWQKLPRNFFELKISVKSFSCQDLNGEEVVIGNGNKLPATGKAKHVCCTWWWCGEAKRSIKKTKF